MKRSLPYTPSEPEEREPLRAPSLAFLQDSEEARRLPVGAIVHVGSTVYHKAAITYEWTEYPPEEKVSDTPVHSEEDVI